MVEAPKVAARTLTLFGTNPVWRTGLTLAPNIRSWLGVLLAACSGRVSIQQSPKIYGGKELFNYYKRLLLAGR